MNGQKQRAGAASGRALVTAIWVLAGVSVGGAGGYYAAPRLSGSHGGKDAAAASASAGEEPQQKLYTCGMHPQVIRKEPGECPICHMPLTPMKRDKSGGSGAKKAGPKKRKILFWRAPMDPGFISKKPGKSPMGMDLVPVYASAGGDDEKGLVRIDPVTIQNMGIRTQVVRKGPLARTIRTVGRVDYDEQTVRYVDTKFSGWIETLNVDETGQEVSKGDPLFSVYSPELFAAEEEYLAALRNLPTLERSTLPSAREGARRLVEDAETKLRYLDVSEETIRRLKEEQVARKILQLRSPAGGIVTEKMALEGMYVKPGMRLFTVADLSRVWVYVDIYEYQLPWVRLGQTAEMTLPYIPGRRFTGKVIYVYPYLNARQRVVKVRLEFQNPDLELKPGMYATVTLRSELGHDVVMVRREAFIDSGKRKVSFLDRGDGKFTPRDIVTGVETEEGWVEVREGLSPGDRVVTSGQFLLDSESKLREAVQKMLEVQKQKDGGAKAAPAAGEVHAYGHAHPGAAGEAAAKPGARVPADARYACSMPKHLGQKDPKKQGPYFSKDPGRCPRCGMDLVPIKTLGWAKALRAAGEGEVAYGCPDHPEIVGAEPGTCPIDQKPLEPFRAMYTCPDHPGEIAKTQGTCPRCKKPMALFRGGWLSEPLAKLAATASAASPEAPALPAGTRFACSMPKHPGQTDPEKQGPYFSKDPGRCPRCGMELVPIDGLDWAKPLLAKAGSGAAAPAAHGYTCPMHPKKVHASGPGTCPICGMTLVRAGALPQAPATAPERLKREAGYVLEHYLALWDHLADDKLDESDTAQHALGFVKASVALRETVKETGFDDGLQKISRDLERAALSFEGKNLQKNRVAFAEVSGAVRRLLQKVRPDKKRWPKLYVFHCPMSKGDWVQTGKEPRNPYYGFQHLRCGDLVDTR